MDFIQNSTNEDDIDSIDEQEEHFPERRHRRDFVGTENERQKKSSRQRSKKRKRTGLDLNEDSIMQDDLTKNEDIAMEPAKKKKKSAPLGVRGSSRVFDVIAENESKPEDIITQIQDPNLDNETLAKSIGKFLWEQQVPIILKCINVFPRSSIERWFRQTIETETNGGMKTGLGERRKSPGGVFFAMVAAECTEEERMQTIGLTRHQYREKFPKPESEQQNKPRSNTYINYKDTRVKVGDFVPLDTEPAPITLNPGRKKTNPFALDSSKSEMINKSSLFGIPDEDLGEAL